MQFECPILSETYFSAANVRFKGSRQNRFQLPDGNDAAMMPSTISAHV
jgi:hypothetical protein